MHRNTKSTGVSRLRLKFTQASTLQVERRLLNRQPIYLPTKQISHWLHSIAATGPRCAALNAVIAWKTPGLTSRLARKT